MLDSLLALLVLLVIVGVAAWAMLGRRAKAPARGRRTSTYRRRSPWARRLPVILIVGAVVFLAIAFTQFRFLRSRSATGTVVLTLDVSESMSRTDVTPSRLQAAVDAAKVFLDGFPTDLNVGLVTFGGTADPVVPPTTHRSEVQSALDALPRSEGTVIGDGLATSLDAIEATWQRDGKGPAAVVLLSDGRDTGSTVTPQQAAQRANDLGVHTDTVLLGQPGSAGGGANEVLLQQIADQTGGASYSATSAGGLQDVYRTLQTKLSTELTISDYGALFVGISAIFAIAATVTILLSLRSEY